MISLGLGVIQVVIGLLGLAVLALFAFIGFILVFGTIAKVLGMDRPKIEDRRV